MAVRRVSVLHAWGAGSGPDRLHVELRDESLIAQIGVIEDDVEFGDVTSLAELQAKAQAEFNRRKNVFTTAVVRAPLSVLPADLTVGDKVTLIDPASGTVVAMDVREIAIEEDAGSGEIVRLGLGTEIRDIIDEVLAGRAKPTGTRTVTPPTSPVPQSLANVTVTFSPDELYADAQGNWWVRVTLNLSGVPRDTRREFIQVRYRRVGDQLYVAGPAIYTKGPTGSASVAGLVPNVAYEFRVVPVGIGGVEGVGVAVTHTTARDSAAPPTPTGLEPASIIRGIRIRVPKPSVADWKLTRVRIKATSGGAAILAVEGAQTEFEITTGLTAGTTYYADAQYEDTSGNVSAWSAEASAVAGHVGPGDIKPARIVLPFTFADSLDESHKMECVFYMPENVIAIRQAIVRLKGQPFRAYSRAAAVRDLFGTPTSEVDLVHTHGFFTKRSSTFSAGNHSHNYSRASGMYSDGYHSHSVGSSLSYTGYAGDPSHSHSYYAPQSSTGSGGSHTHSLTYDNYASTSSVGDHWHDYYELDRILDTNPGALRHYHIINLTHDHGLVFGIYEETPPNNVYCEVSDNDGATWSAPLGPYNDPVSAVVNIAAQLTTNAGFKRLRLSSSRRGRLTVLVVLDLIIDESV